MDNRIDRIEPERNLPRILSLRGSRLDRREDEDSQERREREHEARRGRAPEAEEGPP